MLAKRNSILQHHLEECLSSRWSTMTALAPKMVPLFYCRHPEWTDKIDVVWTSTALYRRQTSLPNPQYPIGGSLLVPTNRVLGHANTVASLSMGVVDPDDAPQFVESREHRSRRGREKTLPTWRTGRTRMTTNQFQRWQVQN